MDLFPSVKDPKASNPEKFEMLHLIRMYLDTVCVLSCCSTNMGLVGVRAWFGLAVLCWGRYGMVGGGVGPGFGWSCRGRRQVERGRSGTTQRCSDYVTGGRKEGVLYCAVFAGKRCGG